MRFLLLGPLIVQADDGTAVPLPRRSQRSTLAVLLLNSRWPITREELIGSLWPEDAAAASADTALRTRVSDLRRILGRDRIVTTAAGYAIALREGEADFVNFDRLARLGRAALDSGHVEEADQLLSRACALWREPALLDLPDTAPIHLTRTALLDARRLAAEGLIDARLELGCHRELLTQIRACIALSPLHEHPHVQLMLALYRSGQKAMALEAFTRLREITTRDLGQDPGPEAQLLLGAILADDPRLLAQARNGGDALPWPAPRSPSRARHSRTAGGHPGARGASHRPAS